MKVSKAVKNARHAWLLALRSGTYKQGTDQLAICNYDPNIGYNVEAKSTQFCCLGVACHLVAPDRLDPEEGRLPDEVAKLFGINSIDDIDARTGKRVKPNSNNSENLQEFLASRNDEYKWSFKRIANYLERLWAKEGGL